MFDAWRTFYGLLGSASATLVGLMFVAASVGTGVYTAERQVGLRTFLSPTVVAFSVVLATSLMAVLPLSGSLVPGVLLGAIGVLGMVYSWSVWRRMARGGITRMIDLEDRAWYIAVPALAYAVLAAAGMALPVSADAGAMGMAAGVCLLLLAGIRNAWDMTTWAVLRRPN